MFVPFLIRQDGLDYAVETKSPKISMAENNIRLFGSHWISRSVSSVPGGEKGDT